MQQRLSLAQRHGRTVLLKTVPLGDAGDRLAHERQALLRLGHPSVVQYVGWEGSDDQVTLVTEYVGPRSLVDLAVGDLAECNLVSALASSASVAAAVADLHAAGHTHGALRADHVLFDRAGRPVLCSFGDSQEASAQAMARDVAQLGETLRGFARLILASVSLDRSQRRLGDQWSDVLSLATESQASAAEVAHLLTELHARAVESVATAAAPSRLRQVLRSDNHEPVDPAPANASAGAVASPSGTRTWRDRVEPLAAPIAAPGPLRRVGAVALVMACVVAGWVGAGLRAPAGGESLAVTSEAQPGPSHSVPGVALRLTQSVAASLATAAPQLTPGTEPWCSRGPGASVCAIECPHPIDVDGDGCGDDVGVSGNLVRVDDHWFRVGATNDLIALGDWDCDGVATPAMLRASTGDVFLFDGWAEPQSKIHEAPVGQVPTGEGLVVRATPGGCNQLIVTTPTGEVTIPMAAAL